MTREENDLIRFGSTGMINYGNDFGSEISCPRCHSVMVVSELAILPPKYYANCYQCGFSVEPEDRKVPEKKLNQGEVSEIFNNKNHDIGDRI